MCLSPLHVYHIQLKPYTNYIYDRINKIADTCVWVADAMTSHGVGFSLWPYRLNSCYIPGIYFVIIYGFVHGWCREIIGHMVREITSISSNMLVIISSKWWRSKWMNIQRLRSNILSVNLKTKYVHSFYILFIACMV